VAEISFFNRMGISHEDHSIPELRKSKGEIGAKSHWRRGVYWECGSEWSKLPPYLVEVSRGCCRVSEEGIQQAGVPPYRMISKVGSASCQDVISCMVAGVGGPGQERGSDHIHKHCRMRKE
jgi:hypothetical protein